MVRAYGDTGLDRPIETARYFAEAPPAPQYQYEQDDWWQDDAYQRSDIVLESHTDPTGWNAQSLAPAVDDRPPAEANSGNRLLTVLLFFAGLGTSVSLWLFETEAGTVNDLSTLMMAVGRILGLTAGYLLFIQLLMMSRVSWLEEWV